MRSERPDQRTRLTRRLGLVPRPAEVVERWLDETLPSQGAAALDAGCGRLSHLRRFRPRIGRMVGVDIHEREEGLGWLDEFYAADVCVDEGRFDHETFDLALSNFTVEHFADPVAAFRIIGQWLRPKGWLVLTTVNRNHPFVDMYLSMPDPPRSRLQALIKRSAADAHPLVGICNTPELIRLALARTGYEQIEVVTTDYLAHAWGGTLPTWVLGLMGDLAAHTFPSRRSTIVARARRPEQPSPPTGSST